MVTNRHWRMFTASNTPVTTASVLSDSDPVNKLASLWRRCLPPIGSPQRHQQCVGEHYRAYKLTPIAAANGVTIGSSTSLGRIMYMSVRLPEQIPAEH